MFASIEEIKGELTREIPQLADRPPLATDEPDPLDQVCRVMLAQNCSRIEIRRNQPCKELRSMYDAFYGRLFRRHSHLCEVAHFFAGETYLGFSKIYPVSNSTVGETMLSFRDCKDTHLACWNHISQEIGGLQSYVVSSPFMQQDGNCGVCAQTALWMALRVIAPIVGRPDVSIPEITTLAAELQLWGPTMPAAGLTWEQMTHVVRKLGYSPILDYRRGTEWYPDGIIYRHIESSLPVVIGLEGLRKWEGVGHAVTVVGHCFEPIVDGSLPSNTPYHTPATFMRSFLVNDDNIGPYCEMPVRPSSRGLENGRQTAVTPYNLYEHATWILGILPDSVNLFAEEAELMAFGMLEELSAWKWYHDLAKEPGGASSLVEAIERRRLVLRTFLINRKAWRRERLSLAGENALPCSLGDIYRQIELPEYIWLIEISTVEMYNSPAEAGQRLIMGEIIVDPTATDRDFAVILLHVPGLLLYNSEPSGLRPPYIYFGVPDDHDYLGCQRSKERRVP